MRRLKTVLEDGTDTEKAFVALFLTALAGGDAGNIDDETWRRGSMAWVYAVEKCTNENFPYPEAAALDYLTSKHLGRGGKHLGRGGDPTRQPRPPSGSVSSRTVPARLLKPW